MQHFVPSSNELFLASRLLETNTGSWNRSDTLSVDTAIGIFKQSGISFKQLRDIWSIADRDGSGKLSKEGLAVVIRLAGWVQAGENLDETLLEKEGPLPKLKGIPDVVVRQLDPPFPSMTSDDVERMKQRFLECEPANGFLQRRQVAEAYIGLMPDLSFEIYHKILQLLDVKDGLIDFKGFAVGMHIVRSLHSSLISSVPSSVPPEDCIVLDDVHIGSDHLTQEEDSDPVRQAGDIALSENVDFDIQELLEDVEMHGQLIASMTLKFSTEYRIEPTEISAIWRQSDVGYKRKVTPTRMTLFNQLLRRWVAKELLGRESSQSSSDTRLFSAEALTGNLPPYSPPTSQTSALSEYHEPPTVTQGWCPSISSFPQPFPDLSPIRPTPSACLWSAPSTALDNGFLPKIQRKVKRLTARLGLKKKVKRPTPQDIHAFRQEFSGKLKCQRENLQDSLARKEEQYRNAELLGNIVTSDLTEQQVVSQEVRDADTHSFSLEHPTGNFSRSLPTTRTPGLSEYPEAPAVTPEWHSSTFRSTWPFSATSRHDGFLPKLKGKVGRLTSRLGVVVLKEKVRRPSSGFEVTALNQTEVPNEYLRDINNLQQENRQLKFQQEILHDHLTRKEDDCHEADKLVDLIKADLLERQVISKEVQEASIKIDNEPEGLWSTVESQSRQITSLLELVADMKRTITELNSMPKQHVRSPRPLRAVELNSNPKQYVRGPRPLKAAELNSNLKQHVRGPRPLRAPVRESKAAATKIFEEGQELRQTVYSQEQEIVELRTRLEDAQDRQFFSQTKNDLHALRNDHDNLKTQMENLQRLMEQHLVASSFQTSSTNGHDNTDILKLEDSTHGQGKKYTMLRRPSLSLHHIVNNLENQFNLPDLPPPLSSSSSHRSLPEYIPHASASNMNPGFAWISGEVSTPSSGNTVVSSRFSHKPAKLNNSQHRGIHHDLEDDLQDLKLHVQRTGYFGTEIVQRFISNYDLDAFSLDEIGRRTGLDDNTKRINHAIDLVRQAVLHPQVHVQKIPSGDLSRSSSSTASSLNINPELHSYYTH